MSYPFPNLKFQSLAIGPFTTCLSSISSYSKYASSQVFSKLRSLLLLLWPDSALCYHHYRVKIHLNSTPLHYVNLSQVMQDFLSRPVLCFYIVLHTFFHKIYTVLHRTTQVLHSATQVLHSATQVLHSYTQ